MSENFNKRIEDIKKDFSSDDVKFYHFKVAKSIDACLIFIDSLTDKKAFSDCVIQPLYLLDSTDLGDLKSKILSPELLEVSDKNHLYREILAGNGVLIIDQSEVFYSVGFKKFDKRTVMEPPTSITLKGPREGFVEDLNTNLSYPNKKKSEIPATITLTTRFE